MHITVVCQSCPYDDDFSGEQIIIIVIGWATFDGSICNGCAHFVLGI